MKKLWLGFMSLAILAACSNGEEDTASVDVEGMDWDEIVETASGSEVGIYMWGGDEGVNAYIDQYVAPELEERYDITLTRYPMDASEFMSRLLTEREADQMNGTADILWINGENFRNGKENDLLYGEFASKLPAMTDYVDQAPYIDIDMGTEIDGMQVPWGNVQYAFQYNPELVDTPPTTLSELFTWVEDNPGLFTYPNVTDFTGNAFVRHVLYDVADDPADLETYNEEWLEENGEEVWERLRSLRENLWRNGDTYPETLAQQDQLFANGEVAMTMGFNEHRAESLIEEGTFPASTETVGLESGSISSTHYLSMPFNSPEPAAALVAVNFMLTPDAQIAKLDPDMWGEGHILDLNALTDQELEAIETLSGPQYVAPDTALLELDARYVDWIQEGWQREVVQGD
ncbi:ABC transporter substrate-binding protein [Paenalkalicoccus suaedae]|uniref:ABC transporter substrate-binding protein n=1 Tax=Paenalkalicoccus suaedae TaxID=2592382 RepID=A0A859FJ32_9BACI|nr:ABC transporter substrate-binding protein [Paenalkalicoccus suaedae]QKS72924.1 ABC transporter substrate-binding protein [Paenalkalicoccus suaedae]